VTVRLLTPAEVADVLGCSRRTVLRRIRSGELPAFRDRGLVRVSERSLAAYVAARSSPSSRPAVEAPSSSRTARRVPLVAGRRLYDEPDPLAPLERAGRDSDRGKA